MVQKDSYVLMSRATDEVRCIQSHAAHDNNMRKNFSALVTYPSVELETDHLD